MDVACMVQWYLSLHSAKALCSLILFVTTAFHFGLCISPCVQLEQESVIAAHHWVNRDMAANEEPSNSC